MANFDFDLAVIGSGPAGHYAAIPGRQAALSASSSSNRTRLSAAFASTSEPFRAKRCVKRYSICQVIANMQRTANNIGSKTRITLPDLLSRVETVVRHEIDVFAESAVA